MQIIIFWKHFSENKKYWSASQSFIDIGPQKNVHGDADPTVTYQQSVDIHKKFLEVGVKTEFITVPGGLHGKFDKDKNSEINKAIASFLISLGLTGN
jgi:dipeptidyl aminopeptidase/acylaminoacyl peptidase